MEDVLQAAISQETSAAGLQSWLHHYDYGVYDAPNYSRGEFATHFIAFVKSRTRRFLHYNDDTNGSQILKEKCYTKFSSDPKNKVINVHSPVLKNHENENVSHLCTSDNCSINNIKIEEQKLLCLKSNELKNSNKEVFQHNTDIKKIEHSNSVVNGIEKYLTPRKTSSFNNGLILSPITPVNDVFSTPERSTLWNSTPNSQTSVNNSFHKSSIAQYDSEASNSNSTKRSRNSRQNICIADFLINDKNLPAAENTPITKKRIKPKYLSLSLNDPLLSCNKENKHINIDRERKDKFDINDKSVFPVIGTKKSTCSPKVIASNQTRRIKPTRLNMTYPSFGSNSVANSASLSDDNIKFGTKFDKVEQNEAFKVQNCKLEEYPINEGFKTERDILKNERENLIEKFNEINLITPKKFTSSVAPICSMKNKQFDADIGFQFNTELVKNDNRLKILSDIFSTILNLNLITNVTSEIYYLISLATTKYDGDNYNKLSVEQDDKSYLKNDVNKLFNCIHNCIYFALATLEKQISFLEVILDKNCLKLLFQNERVNAFSQEFTNSLKDIYHRKSTLDDNTYRMHLESESNKNVCFIMDTDSADNFPSRQNFLTFKNQRDSFYEIFRYWEKSHQNPGWKYDLQLGQKIKSLIMIDTNSSNLTHLARLFKDQLLVTCSKQDKSAETLAHLRAVIGGNNLSQNKINKLAERLTAALPSQHSQIDQNELSCPPTFLGYEEFFRDFIVQSIGTTFREHLINSFVQEIHKLDEHGFLPSEKEESDFTVDQETKHQYLSCVRSLKILGKFLGFLMALPYKNGLSNFQNNVSEQVLQCEMMIRNKTLPSINLIFMLRKSAENNRLILTIPWLVHLLAMLDDCSLRLTYFEKLLHMLYEIYMSRSYNNIDIYNLSNDSIKQFSNRCQKPFSNMTLIKVCLGWLFDMPHFPRDSLYSWLNQNDNIKSDNIHHISLENSYIKKGEMECSTQMFYMKEIDDKDFQNIEKEPSEKLVQNSDEIRMYDVNLEKKHVDFEPNLDLLDIIDDNIMKYICPFLKVFRFLIINNQNTKENFSSKNVRHITPVSSRFLGDRQKNKNADIQMRLEEWFLRSQPGTTRRILELVGDRTGAALVRLAKAQLPVYSQQANDLATDLIKTSQKDDVKNSIVIVYNETLANFQNGCLKAGRHIALKRVHGSLQSLLPPGTSKSVLEICTQICARNALRKLIFCLHTQYNTIKIFTSQGDISKRISSEIDTSLCEMTNTEFMCENLNYNKNIFNSNCNEFLNKNFNNQVIKYKKYEDVYESCTFLLIELKGFILDILTNTHDNDIQYISSKCHSLFNKIDKCCKHDYVEKVMKNTMIQLSLDVVVFVLSFYPSVLNDKFLNTVKNTWDHCMISNSGNEGEQLNSEVEEFRNLMHCEDEKSSVFKMCEKDTSIENCDIFLNNHSLLNKENSVDKSLCDMTSVAYFDTVICARNLVILGGCHRTSSIDSRWSAFARFLSFLLKNNFLTDNSLTEQCLSVYREEWSQNILMNFAKCIQLVMEQYDLKSNSKLNLMLEFIADFCEDLDFSPI